MAFESQHNGTATAQEENMSNIFVITGVNKGLGFALLKTALEKGYRIEGISKSSKSNQIPEGTSFTQLDCSNYSGVTNFWRQIKAKYEPDSYIILINNAGTYVKQEFMKMRDDEIESLLRDNLLSNIFMTKGLLENFERATIINVISIVAIEPGANKSIYGAAKAAMSNFFNALKLELKGKPIKIINIYPHTINTWSQNPEPNAIDRFDLANWIVETVLQTHSFEIRGATILPFSTD